MIQSMIQFIFSCKCNVYDNMDNHCLKRPQHFPLKVTDVMKEFGKVYDKIPVF